MFSRLFDPGPSPLRYIVRMWLIAFLPSIAIAAVLFSTLSMIGFDTEKMSPEFKGSSPAVTFVSVVVVSPLLETMLMSAGIGMISVFTKRRVLVAALSALLWACLHSLASPLWGVVIAWPFFIFSIAYLVWRPFGWSKAVAVAASIHALQNLLPGLLLFIALPQRVS